MKHVCPEVTQGRGMDGVDPITVAEIREAVRRHAMEHQRPFGRYSTHLDREYHAPFIAL